VGYGADVICPRLALETVLAEPSGTRTRSCSAMGANTSPTRLWA